MTRPKAAAWRRPAGSIENRRGWPESVSRIEMPINQRYHEAARKCLVAPGFQAAWRPSMINLKRRPRIKGAWGQPLAPRKAECASS